MYLIVRVSNQCMCVYLGYFYANGGILIEDIFDFSLAPVTYMD